MTTPPNPPTTPRPTPGTVEAWCWDFIAEAALETKLAPDSPPDPRDDAAWESSPPARRVTAPGRPREFRIVARSPRTHKGMGPQSTRASMMHTFLHHELQAAELFAWAILAFPETPREFRRGLLRLCGEELRHLRLYREHLERLEAKIGDYPVRDWFWERVPECPTPAAFVALLGLGLEGANLEHSVRFAQSFRAAGDERGAQILEQVEHDEISHVAFAVKWFERFTGKPLDYDAFRESLPEPLTPAMLQGRPLNRRARQRAGQDETFLERLQAEPPTTIPRVS